MKRTGSKLLSAAVVIVVLLIVLGAAQRFSLLPSFSNPVREKTVDRTGPAVLKAISDLSDYHASTGEFESTVDLEKDVKYIPSAIAGEHILYQGIGSVDGVVNLADLDAKSVRMSKDGRKVTIVVPGAQLSKVTLDVERSKVLARDRGLANRVGSAFSDSPTSEKTAQRAASKKLAAAARQSDLLKRAERNTRAMLTQLLRTAGATDVTVKFTHPAQP